MYAAPYTFMVAEPLMLIVSVLPLHVEPAPSSTTDWGLVAVGAPPLFTFRNAPVSLYEYTVPVESATSLTVAVIDVGVPEQSAVGEHATLILVMFDAMAWSPTATVDAPWHSRRSTDVPTSR